ncbi:unnamed protein product [Allacma fusca]|uniref:Uncharacterized protein n=1 Tax=Allacma fusca TaxID=39272 RepID=A0A8J2LBX1_9HEXA|nr:unnamed protein product [Allacma fusca]
MNFSTDIRSNTLKFNNAPIISSRAFRVWREATKREAEQIIPENVYTTTKTTYLSESQISIKVSRSVTVHTGAVNREPSSPGNTTSRFHSCDTVPLHHIIEFCTNSKYFQEGELYFGEIQSILTSGGLSCIPSKTSVSGVDIPFIL